MGVRAALGRGGLLLALVLLLGACGRPYAALPSPEPTPTPTPTPTAYPSPSPSTSPSPAPSPSQSSRPSTPEVREIKISLSQQHLWAYVGDVVVVSTAVTTGMPALPTPAGTFRITAKYSPYKFISPWPRGSPYFYEPLWVDYAMLFADGGYFIHDAWWQQNFGPGGNLKTGSHGCVNVPVPIMPALYKWAQVGDTVVIVE